MIYFDHAATTSLSPTALQRMIEIAQATYGNPSSIHQAGRKANQVLRQARQDIADALSALPHQIIFTSGGSESNNLAIKGYALSHQAKGKHLITTAIEHHSVLHTMQYLEERFGFEITYIQPINQIITAQQIKEALRPDTILVSTMFANNETGQVLPIKDIGDVLVEHQAVFHVDAVQTIGKIKINPKELGIDFLSASGHKFHGPKGVGFLYSNVYQFDALIHGGKQEQQLRSGTENLPAISAMAVALKEQIEQLDKANEYITTLRNQLLSQLDNLTFYINQSEKQLPHILNIGFPNKLNEQLLMQLDLAGIAVSSGSACTAGAIQQSHVLEAMYGKKSHRLKESIRISMSETNTYEEVMALSKELKTIIGG